LIHCIITLTDGSKVVYEYKKNLPYDVIEKDCNVEVTVYLLALFYNPASWYIIGT